MKTRSCLASGRSYRSAGNHNGKAALKAAYHESLEPMLETLSTFQGETQRTDDHFEALAAFQEKRKPVWTGR